MRPERAAALAYADAQAIRDEIARAVPFYRGIETLRATGDQIQYGGRVLGEGGRFDRPDGRAAFAVVVPEEAPGAAAPLRLTTRRGKQFNSIVHAARDPLTGADREDILIAAADAAARGIDDGDAIVVRSPQGSFRGRARFADLLPGNVQGFWPEVNGLLALDRRDRASGVPDYGTTVTIERGGER